MVGGVSKLSVKSRPFGVYLTLLAVVLVKVLLNKIKISWSCFLRRLKKV